MVPDSRATTSGMSRISAFESLRLAPTLPNQLVCYLDKQATERRLAITEAIRECLTAWRTLGGAPVTTHERLGYLAQQKKLTLESVVGDVLERVARTLPEAPPNLETGLRDYNHDEQQEVFERLKLGKSQLKESGVRFAPQIPLQELAHLERSARESQMSINQCFRTHLDAWRTLGGASVTAHQRIRQYATTKGISLESAVNSLLTAHANNLEDPPAKVVIKTGLEVLPLDGLLERLGEQMVSAKTASIRAAAKKPRKHAAAPHK